MTEVTSRVSRLAKSFPSLRRTPGVEPWEPMLLDEWAASSVISHGELCAAQFLLAVWDNKGDWNCGNFDLMEALSVWDIEHRVAFLSWASQPWWP